MALPQGPFRSLFGLPGGYLEPYSALPSGAAGVLLAARRARIALRRPLSLHGAEQKRELGPLPEKAAPQLRQATW
jgi:hypothetical protein